jgi:ATP-binding cassette subfamily B protein
VLNENIVGAALIRLANTTARELDRFSDAADQARAVGLKILNAFAAMMPIFSFLANVATLTILTLGGWFVISGQMTIGQFTAFNAFLPILIFPIFIIGFTSNAIGQAQASYLRISMVLNAPPPPPRGEIDTPLSGRIEVQDLTVAYGERRVLKGVSFTVAPGSRTAIVGPTAAGKSQLLYVMTGLLAPKEGRCSTTAMRSTTTRPTPCTARSAWCSRTPACST